MVARAHAADEWREETPAEAIHEEASAEPFASPEEEQEDQEEPDAQSPRWPERIATAILGLLAAAWIGVVAWVAARAFAAGPPAAETLIAGIAAASTPLALIGILYLLLRRTSRREARRFARTAASMRGEAAWLGEVLTTLSARIEENRRALGDHAHQLLLLGDDASARLGEISGAMRVETSELSRHSDRLEQAARGARADVAMLLQDLPRAASESRDIATMLRDAGTGAHAQTAALDATLASITHGSRAAEESAGGAAQRLAANLARIESASALAGERIDETATRMSGAVETTLAEAARAVDEARRTIDAQGAAMLAMVEQGRVALDQAGAESARALSARLDEIGSRLDRMAAKLSRGEDAGGRMVRDLDASLATIEQKLEAIAATGTDRTASLDEAMAKIGARADAVDASLERGNAAASALLSRAGALEEQVRGTGAHLAETLPGLIDELDARVARSDAALAAAAPKATELSAVAGEAAQRLGDADAILARQTATIRAIGIAAEERLTTLQEQAERLETALGGSGEQVRQIVDSAGPQLVDALLRVRETARQAADHARDAFALVIPASAGALGEAAEAALQRAVGDRIETQMAEIAASADRAVEAAQRASERLMRQMLTIADTTGLIEARLAEARSEMAEADEDAFARRVALLIDALNSTAINVTGLLSQEVADGAWAAYLKGDRGIFTRRAVRLLDATEAREIQRLYQADSDFREQVNRYVHDFEGLLRRVLPSREGSPLGITLLSSDMGKLYVALAQAIERLRA